MGSLSRVTGRCAGAAFGDALVRRDWLNSKSLLFFWRSVGARTEGCSSALSLSAEGMSPRPQRDELVCLGSAWLCSGRWLIWGR